MLSTTVSDLLDLAELDQPSPTDFAAETAEGCSLFGHELRTEWETGALIPECCRCGVNVEAEGEDS